MRSRIVLFILAYVLWVLLNWKPDWQHLLIGAIVALFVVWLTSGMFPAKFSCVFDAKRYLWALYYIIVLAYECIKANIDVAYRVIHPDLPIRPGIVKIRTALKSDIALTFLANSITLTPGTMSVDMDRDKGILYIHWINVMSQDIDDATKIIAGKFEAILKRIFE
jgi:multicomponent Na+:H+ antiporter subunit E